MSLDTSRYRFCEQWIDNDDRIFIDARKPFRFANLPDNVRHIVIQGDTLPHLAGKYFNKYQRPSGLWWVIADFQPNPIHDPTIQLQAGSALIIPSLQTVTQEIFNVRRQSESRL